MTAERIVGLDNGREVSFSFDEMLDYHGGGSPGVRGPCVQDASARADVKAEPDGRRKRRLATMKAEMAERVMAAPAADVYAVDSG